MNILVINCGSSSIKYKIIDISQENIVTSGKIQRVGEVVDGITVTHKHAMDKLFNSIENHNVDAVGHRVVHGGEDFIDAELIDQSVLKAIEENVVFAPLHNFYNLAAINYAKVKFPDIPHVAVFDTAFHARMPRRSFTYAISQQLADKYRIRRFGFHGTSHAYVANKSAHILSRPLSELRLIILHLGNGASACAVEFGQSVETSMGMTPLEGLVMGTRAGDIDAGAVITLVRDSEYSIDDIDALLNKNSGLKGLSGISNDLREIEQQAAEGNDNARKAINVFAHRARKYIGAYAAVMNGVDAVVFTGGIGENSTSMRQRILQRFDFLGLVLDEDKNMDVKLTANSDHAVITSEHSRVEAIVVKTNEELMIARQTYKIATEQNKIQKSRSIPIAISGRHLHLNKSTFAQLFGEGAAPTKYKDISQPGQYACNEKVNLIGPRDRVEGVRLLGPLRLRNQIEISRSDEFKLGVDAPIRDSGKVKASAPITLEGPKGTVHLKEGLICARRHIHMHPDDANYYGVGDKEVVEVAIEGGPRDLIFGDVLVRVSKNYKLEMHIDTDEANAAELSQGHHGDLVYDDVGLATAAIKSKRTSNE